MINGSFFTDFKICLKIGFFMILVAFLFEISLKVVVFLTEDWDIYPNPQFIV